MPVLPALGCFWLQVTARLADSPKQKRDFLTQVNKKTRGGAGSRGSDGSPTSVPGSLSSPLLWVGLSFRWATLHERVQWPQEVPG